MDKENNPYTELAKSVEEMLSPDEVISKSLTTDDVKEDEKEPETEVPAEDENVKEPETEEEVKAEADEAEKEEVPETEEEEAETKVEEEEKPESTEEDVEEPAEEDVEVEPVAEEEEEVEDEPKAEVVVDAPTEKVEKSITLEAEPIKAVSPEFEKAMLSIVEQFATRMNNTLESVEEIKKSLEAIKAEKVETISKSMDEELDLSDVEGKAVAVAPKEAISKSLTDDAVAEEEEEVVVEEEPKEPTFDFEGLREKTNATFLESITRMTQDDAEATRNYLRETLPTHGGAQAVTQDTINIIQEINKKYN